MCACLLVACSNFSQLFASIRRLDFTRKVCKAAQLCDGCLGIRTEYSGFTVDGLVWQGRIGPWYRNFHGEDPLLLTLQWNYKHQYSGIYYSRTQIIHVLPAMHPRLTRLNACGCLNDPTDPNEENVHDVNANSTRRPPPPPPLRAVVRLYRLEGQLLSRWAAAPTQQARQERAQELLPRWKLLFALLAEESRCRRWSFCPWKLCR